jgi:hypothetical protein
MESIGMAELMVVAVVGLNQIAILELAVLEQFVLSGRVVQEHSHLLV